RLSGGRWRLPELLLFAAGAIAGVVLTSLPSTSLEPSPWIVAPAAAIAVCALVLPGVSGSFLLLSIGLYQPTLQAVDERDLGYIAWFGLWACVGLVVIVRLMRHLLVAHHRGTMVVLAGVMIGALRSLWPWQGEAGALPAPGADWPLLLGLAAAGVLAVQLLVLVEARTVARAGSRAEASGAGASAAASGEDGTDPAGPGGRCARQPYSGGDGRTHCTDPSAERRAAGPPRPLPPPRGRDRCRQHGRARRTHLPRRRGAPRDPAHRELRPGQQRARRRGAGRDGRAPTLRRARARRRRGARREAVPDPRPGRRAARGHPGRCRRGLPRRRHHPRTDRAGAA